MTSLKRGLQIMDRIEHSTLVWTILGLALVAFIEVIARYVFNHSFTWFEELGRYLGIFLAFLGAAIGARTGTHFAMDLVVSRLKQPWQAMARALSGILSGGFFLIVAWYSWKIVQRLYGFGSTSPAMGIPLYIPYLPILVFSFIMGIRFLITAIRQPFIARTGS